MNTLQSISFFNDAGRRRVLLLSLAFFLPAIIIIVLLSTRLFQNEIKRDTNAIQSSADKALLDRQQFLTRQNADIVNDLHFITTLSSVRDILLHPQVASVSQVKKILLSLSDTSPLYRRIRIFDISGRELLSVAHKPGERAFALPDSLLHSRPEGNFFAESLKLSSSDVYVSPFEPGGSIGLNLPDKREPVLRYGTPIRDEQGKVLGVVVISCYGQALVKAPLAYGAARNAVSMVLTSNGYFINGAPDGDNWRFLAPGENTAGSFSSFFPKEWQRIAQSPSGHFVTSKGLFAFRRLYLVNTPAISGAQSKPAHYWIMVIHVPDKELQAALPSIFNYFLITAITGIFLFIGAVTLSDRIERSRSSRKELMLLAADLKEKEFRFRSLFEGSPEAIFLIHATSGLIEGVNRKARELTGIEENELTGKPFTVLHPDNLVDDFKARFEQHVREARSSGASIPDETVVRHRSGKLIPVEIVSQLIRLDGREIMYVIYHDLTWRKQAESELHAKTLLLETVAAAVPAFVYMKDRNGKYQFANRALLDCLSLSDMETIVGKTDHEVFPDSMAKAYALDDSEIMSQGSALMNREEEAHLPDGTVIPVLTNKIPLMNANGDVEGIVGISMDRTAQKEADEKSRKLETQLRNGQKLEMLGTLSGGVAHYFNNMLTPIIGFTDMAISELPENNKVVKELEYVLEAGMRAKNMVQHMLVFSRQEPPSFTIQKLQPIIHDSIEFLKHSIPAYVSIRKNIEEFDDTVSCDATQIEQVVMNLCTNGWQALQKGQGELLIELSRVVADEQLSAMNEKLIEGNGYVLLKVSDNGVGMASGVIERMFDPFFTTKAVGQGTGLGLSVVYGIVMEHQGVVHVESTLGKGTSIFVYLPLAINHNTLGARFL